MAGFHYYDEINNKKTNKIESLKRWVLTCAYVNKSTIAHDFVINQNKWWNTFCTQKRAMQNLNIL